MLRFLLFLLLIIFINNRSFAQQINADNNSASEKKAVPVSSNSTPGFKKRSSNSVEKQKNTKNSNPVSINSSRNVPVSTSSENTAKTMETIRIDYNNMPAVVQLKVNNNKAAGKNLLEGIAKVFSVEIKTCITDADHKKILSFLKAKKGFINSQFVSEGLVRIIVEPTFDSVDLKDALLTEGIRFNFLNRSYLLKK